MSQLVKHEQYERIMRIPGHPFTLVATEGKKGFEAAKDLPPVTYMSCSLNSLKEAV